MLVKYIMKNFSFLLLLLFLLSGCSREPEGLLKEVLQQKELVVVTRNAPTTYYDWHDELTGVEYDMTQAFANSLGVKVKYIIKDSTAEILEAIKKGEAHIAAAGLTKTETREDSFLFGPVYQHVQQQVVCRRGGKRPRKVEDLVALSLVVPAETSYVERLNELQTDFPELAWSINSNGSSEELLEQVWLKKVDCTIADSNITDINRRYYPELNVRFSISKPESVAWVLPADADALLSEVEHWFDEFEDSGDLQRLMERYYGFIEVFDYVDTRKFVKRIYKVLPKYKKHFKQAASKYDLDWTLLAAQSYQESHWRPHAKSPTGVRGMMMLTLTTADELGVQSRLDPVQSIMGGARYLRRLHNRVPEDVQEPDRTWFALAAYNVGMGHLYDAMELAKRLDKNPYTWESLSEVFPLLTQKKYYKTLKHGYARGREPVSYVRHIRDYQNILLQKLNNN
jgi:membrane-bound lytic murein transglycosylase F